ncbi:nuclear transport factor 2 family protein [Aminobacter carboxidus]|uniref:Nuclear transport factor 2 family protein n=1 Tax=Aminobacter carboxidus TaxID=376165 RepID=A0ABR9GRS1_9HYPH|nr:nuclear transport factor 2 family protein [Aminobacter carboxidus]MBE1206383.1 nuclear transport factor 2 family protein [Aminobacter carboxidus]
MTAAADHSAAYAEVAHALADYFDGLHFSDTKRLSRIFHPQAIYACATEGELLRLTMQEYFPIVDKRPSPASRSEPRVDRIVSIEFAGAVTAFAKLNCAIGPKHFTDFLTLVKLEGRWQIMAKVFHFDVQSN